MFGRKKQPQPVEKTIEVLETTSYVVEFNEYGQPTNAGGLVYVQDDREGNPVFRWQQKSDADRGQTWYKKE